GHDRRRSPGGGGDQLRPQRPRHRPGPARHRRERRHRRDQGAAMNDDPTPGADVPADPLIPRSALRSAALTTVLALVGATVALWLIGPVRVAVGPVTTGVSVTPALGGPVTLDLAPLGQVEIAPTYAPIRLRAEVADLDPAAVSDVVTKGRAPELDLGSTLPRTLIGAIVTYVGVAALG